ESQDVSISYGVFNQIIMQAFIKDVSRGPPVLAGVCFKPGRAGKTKILRILKMLFNSPVHIAKLTSMTLIDDKDDFIRPVTVHHWMTGLNCIGHFLNRRYVHVLSRIVQLLQ